uniref:Uncharacterized protein n=1 Tax=Rhizophora mucronata TaxID=61149 RepID=A0A2P2QJ45_RHIMU
MHATRNYQLKYNICCNILQFRCYYFNVIFLFAFLTPLQQGALKFLKLELRLSYSVLAKRNKKKVNSIP